MYKPKMSHKLTYASDFDVQGPSHRRRPRPRIRGLIENELALDMVNEQVVVDSEHCPTKEENFTVTLPFIPGSCSICMEQGVDAYAAVTIKDWLQHT
jgi:hypothetical protein